MEGNTFLDIIKIVLGSALGIFITAIFPFILAVRKEREEKAKLSAERESIGADAVQKIVTAAGDLQDAYGELLEEMKKRNQEYKSEIDGLSSKIKELEKSNLELKLKVEEESKIISELIEGVKLLTKQVEELGKEPAWKSRGG